MMNSQTFSRSVDRIQQAICYALIAVLIVAFAGVGLVLGLLLGAVALALAVIGMCLIGSVLFGASLLKLGVMAFESFVHVKAAKFAYGRMKSQTSKEEPIAAGPARSHTQQQTRRRKSPYTYTSTSTPDPAEWIKQFHTRMAQTMS